MARRFATAINLQQSELQNARIQNLAAAPGTGVVGQIYYDTVLLGLYVCTNATGPVFTKLQVSPVTSADISNGTIVSADISGTAGITYGQLSLTNSIVNGDLVGSIAYSKLALTNSIVNGDLVGGIAYGKLALTNSIVNGDLVGGIAYGKLTLTNSIVNGDLVGSIAYGKLTLTGAIVTGDISATLKPSGSAAVGTESLRAIGTTASTAMAGNTALNAITAPTGSVAMNSQKITGLLDGTAAQDAVSLAQLQSVSSGIDVRASVHVASTATVTLATPGATIDGVSMVAGDRVLLKDQSSGAENGIWVWNGAATLMTRATDADTSAEVTPGLFTFVEEGTVNSDTGWVLTTNAPIVLATTALTFTQFSGAGSFTDGAGLLRSGNVLNVVGTTNRITVAADSVDISTSYVGQATITTLGTIATGVWNGTTIAVANGGTGATTAPLARTALTVPGRYDNAATHTLGTTISITAATHALGTGRNKVVQVLEESTGEVIDAGIVIASNGDVTVSFDVSQSANTMRVCIIGW